MRDADPLLPLRAGLAVADLAGGAARVKWPNDVLVDGRKVAGVLVEGRPQEGWAVLGIGVNVAVDLAALPPELRGRAGTLGRARADLRDALTELLCALERRLDEPRGRRAGRAARARRAARRHGHWAGGEGIGAGIDEDGALRVRLDDGGETTLDAGEVHLGGTPREVGLAGAHRSQDEARAAGARSSVDRAGSRPRRVDVARPAVKQLHRTLGREDRVDAGGDGSASATRAKPPLRVWARGPPLVRSLRRS